jgi:hypothetical protein
MKQRAKDYMDRKKAQCHMRHPEDLKSFLIAEHDASRNLVVKKDIMKMIARLEELEHSGQSVDTI